jgi:spore coat protein U-like protein
MRGQKLFQNLAVGALLSSGFIAALGAGPAIAATATGSFNVTITITSQCSVSNATNMAFPSTGLLSAAVNQTSTFNVTCTNTTPYTIGLDSGLNVSGAQRRMLGGVTNTEFVSYNLYSDAGRTIAWGDVSGSWVSGTGTGSATAYTVYGQVPAQATPSPSANYTDTVTITVTY